MQLKIIEWELDNLEVKALPELSEGDHILYIEEASYLPDDVYQRFTFTFRSMTKDERSTISFFLSKNGIINENTYGTLNSMKHALAGPNSGKGILSPPTVLHGLVKATVKLSKPYKGNDGQERVYRNIYHFEPVSESDYEIISASEDCIPQYVVETDKE